MCAPSGTGIQMAPGEISHQELKRSSSVGDKRQWVQTDLPSQCT